MDKQLEHHPGRPDLKPPPHYSIREYVGGAQRCPQPLVNAAVYGDHVLVAPDHAVRCDLEGEGLYFLAGIEVPGKF